MIERLRATLLAALLALCPRAAHACAACFGGGAGTKGLFEGFWWAIVSMLVIVLSLVAGIGWTAWSIERARGEKHA